MILVSSSLGSCGRISPVRRSTTPPSVFINSGYASSSAAKIEMRLSVSATRTQLKMPAALSEFARKAASVFLGGLWPLPCKVTGSVPDGSPVMIHCPAAAVPDKPFPPVRNSTESVAMGVDQAQCVA